MKLVIFAAVSFAVFAVIAGAPASISGNNIGDVINVGVNANLKLNSTLNQDIVNVIVALINDQRIGVDVLDHKKKSPTNSPKSADLLKLLSQH